MVRTSMPLTPSLAQRCDSKCELCSSDTQLHPIEIPASESQTEIDIALCDTCAKLIEADDVESKHWHCLKESMWSQVPAVQVMAWRLLKKMGSETWAQDALDILYLDDNTLAWAKAESASEELAPIHKDINGVTLNAGDNVVITKDLNVKGTSFVAKRGTTVRGISLTDNAEHIEGRVNGTRIVLLTKFVKKS